MITPFLASAILSLSIPSIGMVDQEVMHCKAKTPAALQRCINKNDVVLDANYPILMGHNHKSLGKVYDESGGVKIKRGDSIEFAGKNYRVSSVKVLKHTDTWILKRNAELLLYTCFPLGSSEKRLVISAEKN